MNGTSRIVYFALSILLGGAFQSGWAQESEETLTPEKATSLLDSESFADRERATLYLWSQGAEAEPFVRDASENGSPEVQQRALRILEAFELGITPDTPAEMIALIYQFRDGDYNARAEVIRRLSDEGDWRRALQLARSVNDLEIRERLASIVTTDISSMISPLLARGETEQALELLETLAFDDDQILRDLGIFHFYNGTLEQALTDAENRTGEWKRHAWFLRVQGRIEEAIALGEKEKDEVWINSVRAGQGDALAYVNAMLASEITDPIEQLSFELTKHRLEGNQDDFDNTLTRIGEWIEGQDQAFLKQHAFEALFLNDATESFFEIITESEKGFLFDIHTGRWDLEPALEAVGVQQLRPPFTEWTNAVKLQLRQGDSSVLLPALEFAQYIEGMGEKEEARRIFRELGEACLDDSIKLTQIIFAQSQTTLNDPLREHIKQEVANGSDVRQLLSLVLDRDDMAERWWDFLRNHFHEKTDDDVIDIMWRLVRPDPNDKPDARDEDALPNVLDSNPLALIEVAYRSTFAYDRSTRSSWLNVLYETCLIQGFDDLARDYLEEWVGLAPNPNNLQLFGDILIKEEKWSEAQVIFEQNWKLNETDAVALYLHGWALEKAGDHAKAAEAIRNARLLPLGDGMKRLRLASTMYEKGDEGRAMEEWDLVARTDDLAEWSASVAFQQLAREFKKEDPAKAARYQERAILALLQIRYGLWKPRVPVIRMESQLRLASYQAMRGRVHEFLALAHAKENNTEGLVQAALDFHQLMPGNSSIAEEILPLLEKAGKTELADRLYDEVHARCLKGCEIFPNSGMAFNNLAWLNARALRNLEEARRSADKAVALQPDSAAYIDTLAEVYFVEGNRAKAIELSEKAVALTPDDLELVGQLERFRNEPIPQRP